MLIFINLFEIVFYFLPYYRPEYVVDAFFLFEKYFKICDVYHGHYYKSEVEVGVVSSQS